MLETFEHHINVNNWLNYDSIKDDIKSLEAVCDGCEKWDVIRNWCKGELRELLLRKKDELNSYPAPIKFIFKGIKEVKS